MSWLVVQRIQGGDPADQGNFSWGIQKVAEMHDPMFLLPPVSDPHSPLSLFMELKRGGQFHFRSEHAYTRPMSDATESSHTEQTDQVVPQDAAPEPQLAPQAESKPEQQPHQADPIPQQDSSPKPAENLPEPVKQQLVEAPKPEPRAESTKRFWINENNWLILLGKGWGWGWGIISSVSSKVGEYVKPALDTVGDTGN